MASKKIEPTILKGTRDFLPAEMARRNFVMDKIRGIFERYGYEPIETPILSPAETILGKYGEEGDRLTYHFEDQGGREVALPYDLTVPFARFAAANWRELPMPFKRYQIQRVWRAEKPQKGRLREFYQCDIDVIGTKSILVEAEVAKLIVEVFTALGIPDFKIKVNSRRLMNAVLDKMRVPADKKTEVIRAIDKIEKIGGNAVGAELMRLGIPEAVPLLDLLAPTGSNGATIEKLKEYDVQEITDLFAYAKDLGVGERYFEFDPSLARGLDYYTGLIFEVTSSQADFGTLCAGGRYDDLTALFEVNAPEGAEVSGMGVAFGFERIMLVLEELGLLGEVRAGSKVLVAQFPGLTAEARKLYGELSAAGIPSEIYFEPAKLDKQLKFADKKQIPYVAMVGPEEAKENMVTLKNMATGEQKRVVSSTALKELSANA